MNKVDMVRFQYRSVIFRGKDGAHILEIFTNLRMQVVTTLHPILQSLSAGQESFKIYQSRFVIFLSHADPGRL